MFAGVFCRKESISTVAVSLRPILNAYRQNTNSTTASGSSIVWLPGNCRRGVVARALCECVCVGGVMF